MSRFRPFDKTIILFTFIFKKNTSLLFLKGRNVKKEIDEAKQTFNFKHELFPSQSVGGGFVLKINQFKKL